ncbi:MAG TPA: ACT domain-containing protein [Gammaproteobacteria bacterium]
MSNWCMLTLVGADRPGIVAAITQALFQGGANLGETSMARLGGNFTVMMMVQHEGDTEALRSLVEPVAASLGLRLHLDPIEAHLHEHPIPDVRISVFGADRAGIVAQVTTALAQVGFNILDLQSDVGGSKTAPFYVLHIEGQADDGVEAIEQALAPLRDSGVEVEVQSIETMIG